MKTKKLKTGFYGKLPFYKEFIRTGDFRSETRGFEDFLHGGESERRARPETVETVPRTRFLFLFSPQKGSRILAGTLRPSTDGLRPFPITQFCHLRRRPVFKQYFLLPLLLEEFWQASDLFLTRSFSNLQDFVQQSRELPISVPGSFSPARERFRDRMERSTIRELPPPPVSMEDADRGWTARVFRNLYTTAGIERAHNTRRGGVSLAFWLPIHGNRETRLSLASFWLKVLDVVLGKPRSLPSVFIADHDDPQPRPGMFIVFRPVISSDFVCIMEGHAGKDTISDLTADWGNVGSGTALDDRLDQALHSPETTLDRVLAILEGRTIRHA